MINLLIVHDFYLTKNTESFLQAISTMIIIIDLMTLQVEQTVWDENGEERTEVKEGKKEVTTHLAIHTLHLDGLRELHRHFLRLPDGAIVEVMAKRWKHQNRLHPVDVFISENVICVECYCKYISKDLKGSRRL